MSIVTNNQLLLQKLDLLLIVGKGKVKKFSELSSGYKSAKIFINNDKIEGSRSIESSLRKHQHSITNLELRGFLKKDEIFYIFLKPILTITHLTITNIYPEDCDEEVFPDSYKFEKICLPTLKFLEIDNCLKLLPLIDVPNLETLKIFEERRYLPIFYLSTDNYANEMERIKNEFFNFIKKCEKLKCLHMDAIRWPKVYNEPYAFKLQKVSLQSDYIEEKYLINFLMSHKDTLKRAAVMAEGTSKVIEHLLKDFNLSYLDVDLSSSPKDMKINYTNYSIKQLELPVFPIVSQFECSLGPRSSRNIIPGPGIEIVKACVNVESLGFYDYHRDLLKPISEMRHLKTLKIYLPPSSLPEEKFNITQVENLEIDWIPRPVPYIEQLINFLPLLTNLKRLKINKFDNATEETFENIVSLLPHLIELHLGTTLKFSIRMMHAINDARKKKYSLERLSFLENENRSKEFACFRVEHFFFRSYDKESGFFNTNRFSDCDNRKFEMAFKMKKEEFYAIDWQSKK